ncbi:TadE/TadG family type IV pilus assembly protein [Brenneria populi]|uniref:TadE/TadG family type IV pilus assembly protein n=1 Tax=Brenneria populi TaxID=1505588 RepID=A0ABU6JRJ3_9GAMM|nr:TadE/TadG family type IV pilus assembly protein [Brenneria populi Li et al. 2015]
MIKPVRFLLTLQRDQRGAVALTYLLCFPLILLALLGSIDFIRYSMAQSKLQNALDTAVISAGRNLDTFTPVAGSEDEASWRADAISYFFSNMPRNFLGSSVTEDRVTITYSEETDDSGNATGGQLVQMSAVGTLPLLVTGMIERTSFNLAATNEAVRRTRNDLEMVLALDNTGSMSNENRIGKLKTAATSLVNTVLGAAAQKDGGDSKSYIGIVPFADTVYIGQDKKHWLSADAQALPYIAADKYWGGCVVEPYVNGTFKAKPGKPGDFEPLMTVGTLSEANGLVTTDKLKEKYASDHGIDVKRITSFKILSSPTPTIRGDRAIQIMLNGSGDMVPKFAFNPDWLYTSNMNNRYDFCLASREMTFLSNDESNLAQKIGAMDIDGGTVIPLGLLWAWRMLDPAWKGDNGWGDAEKPRDPALGLQKVIVLLTDGNNGLDPNESKSATNGVVIDGERNISGSYTVKYNYQATVSGSLLTGADSYTSSFSNLNDDNAAYFIPHFYVYADRSDFNSLRVGSDEERNNRNTRLNPYGALFASSQNGQGEDWQYGNPTLNLLTAELCTNIRAKGITIYTVVLGSGTNASTQTLMQNCSSGAGSYYFNATNVDNLSAAFASIAASLTELRLNK